MGIKPSSRWSKIPKISKFQKELNSIISDKERKGIKILDLTEGDPVIFGHKNQGLSNALIEAAEKGYHMYPDQTSFREELREAISDFEKRHRSIKYNPDNIILGAGVANCLMLLHYSLLEPGDEIVILEPAHYYGGPTSYWHYFNAKKIASPCREENNWDPDVDELRKKVTSKTKGIVLVNPNNPTGSIYSPNKLKEIVDVAGENELPLISDEIYGLLTFSDKFATPTAKIAGDVPVIALNGISKIFMRTGWRIGSICFHDPEDQISELVSVVKKVATMYGHGTTSIPTPMLYAAIKAYRGPIDEGLNMSKELRRRRDIVMRIIEEIEGVSCVESMGSLYTFPKVEQIGKVWRSDEDFMLDLVRDKDLLFNLGSSYGPSGFRHFRLLLLPEVEILEDALTRLDGFLSRHQSN